jgi:hypothetical protein
MSKPSLLETAAALIREMKGEPVAKAEAPPVPQDPGGDPDRMDTRAEGAEPTAGKMDEAKEEAGAAAAAAADAAPAPGEGGAPEGGAAPAEGAAAAPAPGEAGPEGGSEDDGGAKEQVAKGILQMAALSGLDFGDLMRAAEGSKIDIPEEVKKAFSGFESDDKDGLGLMGKGTTLLTELLTEIRNQNNFLSSLGESLKKLAESQVHLKEDVAKSLDGVTAKATALQTMMDALPKVAPAAPGRAHTNISAEALAEEIAKAQVTKKPQFSAADLFQLALSGKMETVEIAQLNRAAGAPLT